MSKKDKENKKNKLDLEEIKETFDDANSDILQFGIAIKDVATDGASFKNKIWKPAWKDTKKIIKRGNIIFLAIGVVLGTTFGAVVSSLSKNVILAAISNALNLQSVEDLKTASGVEYGLFISNLLSFLVVMFLSFAFLMSIYVLMNYFRAAKIRKHELKYGKITPEEKPKVVPTDQLILLELQKLNKNLELKQKTSATEKDVSPSST